MIPKALKRLLGLSSEHEVDERQISLGSLATAYEDEIRKLRHESRNMAQQAVSQSQSARRTINEASLAQMVALVALSSRN